MIYGKVLKHVLLPLYLAKNRNHTLTRLRSLERSQYLPPEEMAQRQLQMLKRLLAHCRDNVPFYRARFSSAGFDPEGLSTLADLRLIPCLTKEELQQHLPELVAQNFPQERLLPDSSGGSTGKPTNFFKDHNRLHDGRADQFRHDRWCGWDVGEKFVTLWGAAREFEAEPSLKDRLVQKYLYRSYGFNAFDITEARVLEYLAELRKIRPTMILAYANVAHLFAKVMARHGIEMSGVPLKGMICSAESLTPEMRSAIEGAFSCKVLNRYGCREVGLIASECLSQEGLHINAESLYLEVERNGGEAAPGETGEVIVTDLWNYGMPFIRYRMGDIATRHPGHCPCGRTLPMLKEVQGRVSDFLVDHSGKLVHGEYFTHLFYGTRGVRQFQLVQEDLDHVTLRVLPDRDFDAASLDPVLQKIKVCLGPGTRIDLKLSDTSFAEGSGKFRFTISKITANYM